MPSHLAAPANCARPRGIVQASLSRILKAYISYYNGTRTHLSLKKDAPIFRAIEWVGRISSVPILGGLYHQYCLT